MRSNERQRIELRRSPRSLGIRRHLRLHLHHHPHHQGPAGFTSSSPSCHPADLAKSRDCAERRPCLSPRVSVTSSKTAACKPNSQLWPSGLHTVRATSFLWRCGYGGCMLKSSHQGRQSSGCELQITAAAAKISREPRPQLIYGSWWLLFCAFTRRAAKGTAAPLPPSPHLLPWKRQSCRLVSRLFLRMRQIKFFGKICSPFTGAGRIIRDHKWPEAERQGLCCLLRRCQPGFALSSFSLPDG